MTSGPSSPNSVCSHLRAARSKQMINFKPRQSCESSFDRRNSRFQHEGSEPGRHARDSIQHKLQAFLQLLEFRISNTPRAARSRKRLIYRANAQTLECAEKDRAVDGTVPPSRRHSPQRTGLNPRRARAHGRSRNRSQNRPLRPPTPVSFEMARSERLPGALRSRARSRARNASVPARSVCPCTRSCVSVRALVRVCS